MYFKPRLPTIPPENVRKPKEVEPKEMEHRLQMIQVTPIRHRL